MSGSIDARWVERQLDQNSNRVLNPSACHRALAALKRPSATFSDIAELLAADPYIAAKVMAVAELARPPQEGDAPRLCSIDRAVALLGVRQVEALVLAVMLTGPLAARPFTEHRPDLWRYTFGCAAAGDWLVRRLPRAGQSDELSEGESLVCGLVLGLGVQLLFAGLGASYSRLLGPRVRPTTLVERERKQLGVDHHQVTYWALEAMRCPANLARYPWALATQETSDTALEARAIELLACRAAGFEATRSATTLAHVLGSLGLGGAAKEVGRDLPAIRRRVGGLARAFKLDLAMTDEQRENLHHDTLRRAGRSMSDLVEREARRGGPDAA